MTTVPDARRELTAGAERLGVPLTSREADQLMAFHELLLKWNRTYNLISRKTTDIVHHHLLDCLAIRPHIGSGKVMDLGTGAGLPGLPLAIVCPDNHFTLLDSSGKKTRFITQALLEIRLANVSVVNARAEDFDPADSGAPFDLVVARALGSLSMLVRLAAHLVAGDGRIVAMKGPVSERELAELDGLVAHLEAYRLDVPGVAAERNLVVVSPLPDVGEESGPGL